MQILAWFKKPQKWVTLHFVIFYTTEITETTEKANLCGLCGLAWYKLCYLDLNQAQILKFILFWSLGLAVIECFPSGVLETNTYVIYCKENAVIVDPAFGCENSVFQCIQSKKCTVQAIWITHSHFDHISGCGKILEKYSIPIAVHFLDAENLRKPGSDLLPMWIECQPINPSILLKDKSLLYCGESEWLVVHTPGHTPGSSCFYSAKEKILISGDTLFRGTCGRYSFPTSDQCLMGESLLKLSSFPEETIVLPGHGEKTSIAREKGWMRSLGSQLLES